jgi:hypothetical protein
VNAGDLVLFRCIGAGKTDNPPYSQDGQWRTGLILEKRKVTVEGVKILYRGHLVFALLKNCVLIGDV